MVIKERTHPAITRSKLTIETLEQGRNETVVYISLLVKTIIMFLLRVCSHKMLGKHM